MVVGVGGYMTDPVVLNKLGTHLNVALRIHGRPEPPLFHPKLYLFHHQHFHRTLKFMLPMRCLLISST